MSFILQQSVPYATSRWGLLVISLGYFLFPYYDAPTFLLVGKLLFALFFLVQISSLRPFPPRQTGPLLILLGAGGFLLLAYYSCLWSPAPWRTFKHVSEEVLLNLVVFATATFWVKKASEKELSALSKVILFSFGWVLFLYLFFYFWWLISGRPFWPLNLAPKEVSPWSLLFWLPDWHDVILDRQNLASYLLFPCSIFLGFLIYPSAEAKKNRLGYLLGFLLFFAFLFLTSKRSALLGLFVGGFGGAVLTKRYRLLIYLFGLALLVILVVWQTPVKKYFVRENFRLFLKADKEKWATAGSIPQRYYGLPYYLSYIKKHPLRGIGFGRFNIKLNPETNLLRKKAHLAHAHNVIINMALHLGLLGAFFFLLFLLGQFVCFWNAFKLDGKYAPYLLGFLIYFIAFWLRYQFDDSFRYATSALYYLNTGIGLGLSLREING